MAEIGYTSSPQSGGTALGGTETLRVTIPKKGIGAEFERFEGKTFSIEEIRDVTVFVRRSAS